MDTWITIVQLVFTVIGGGFALFLFYRTNQEKRKAFMLDIYDRMYNDLEIREVIYAVDKRTGLEPLQLKIDNKTIEEVPLEREVDKTLRYLDFIGSLVKQRLLTIDDIQSLRFEIREILTFPTIVDYYNYHIGIKINYDNLLYLKEIVTKSSE